MDSLLFIAALAIGPTAHAVPARSPVQSDVRCYRLMADLAAAEDPRVRQLGIVGAQYYLGRLDTAQRGFDPGAQAAPALPADAASRGRLLESCGAAMTTNGRTYQSLGRSLAPRGPSV